MPIIVFLMLLCSSLCATAADWKGFAREAGGSKRWLWRGEFFGAFATVDEAAGPSCSA